MWVVLVGILMVYFLGFLIYICYNTSRKRGRRNSSSSTERIQNPSSGNDLSATLRPDGTILSSTIPTANCCALTGNGGGNQSHHQWNWSRRRSSNPPNSTSLHFGLPPSCLYYNEITLRNSDLPQSALTAQREQQLRQIKLEINELSRRLGIGQIYRERQLYLQSNGRRRRRDGPNYNPIPQTDDFHSTPIHSFTTSSGTPPETLARVTRTRNTNSLTPRGSTRSLIIDGESCDNSRRLRRPRQTVIPMTEELDRHLINDDEEGSSSDDCSSSLDNDDATTNTCTLSNSLPFALTNTNTNTTNSCSSSISGLNVDGDDGESLSHSVSSSSPATGLGLVQTFTLDGGGSRRNEIFHQRQRRLRLIRMEIEDLTLQLSSANEDHSNSEHNAGGGCSSLEGLVFDRDTEDNDDEVGDHGLGSNLNNSSSFPYFGELPSYDESIIVDFDDPPPSYEQCTNPDAFSSQLITFLPQYNNVLHTQNHVGGHQTVENQQQQSEDFERMAAFYSTCQDEKNEGNPRQGSS